MGPRDSIRRTAWSVMLVAGLAASVVFIPAGSGLLAQGVTTAGIRGIVRAVDESDVDGAKVRVVNTATGFVVDGEVRHGRFLTHGLELGGPYTIHVERPGFHPQQRERVFLAAGELLELHFVLQPAVFQLDTVRVRLSAFPQANAHGGTATTVPDSLLHRLPTLNRNLYDFVRLAPQISTRIGFAPGGMSGGGVGFRFNNFLTNGVPERSVPGAQPAEFAGGRSIPYDAVSEYQLLIAPFDVRYGDFAGALVNVITKSGTNELAGSWFAYTRNEALARKGEGAIDPYARHQYGFTLGGPIRRDRLHFFVASELERLSTPSAGPYVGQPATAPAALPVAESDIVHFDRIMRDAGLIAGSGAAVENRTGLRNVFTRFDAALPEWNSRAVAWVNVGSTRNLAFARVAPERFPLTTHMATHTFSVRTAAVQLNTALPRLGGAHNELLVSHRAITSRLATPVRQPIVQVRVPGTSGGEVEIVSGPPEHAQGRPVSLANVNLRNSLVLPVGARHVATLGIEAESFRVERGGVPNVYGAWTFASLDSLAAGLAERFEVRRDLGSADVPITGSQLALHAGNRWRASDRLSLTIGVRADLLLIAGRAPYHPEVDSIFARRTDVMPGDRVHLSPRLGFTWDPVGRQRDQLRGGVGVFTGRPPVAWLHSALHSYGLGVGFLRCGRRPTDDGPPPAFDPDHRAPPQACANGVGFATAPRGDVNLLDPGLRMAQTLRGVLGYDRRLGADLFATVEVLLTRSISDFMFVNLNLAEPRAIDRFGRVIYGSIPATGLASPDLRSRLPEVIELRNTSRNHAYQLSARIEKRFAHHSAATMHYTFSRVRDVQTPLRVNVRGTANWASRAVSGRHDDLTPGVSLNDIPHRLVVAGTQRAPWRRWSTELAYYYIGESGSPFTYRAFGAGPLGDLNADGSNQNDPIYVPRSAFDAAEIHFDGDVEDVPRQQAAFERFVERTPCLRRQRGSIVQRNSCREPWAHTTVASLRQSIPLAGRTVEAQVDAYNVLDLMRSDRGRYRVAIPELLEHVGQTAGPPGQSQPIFRFDEQRPDWLDAPAESSFQLQLALRYRF
jgi:hypothetical protein